MFSLSIFAAVDKHGLVRFVGDVPRGAACGCFCEACGSPLVAKRGEVREWHFAHEARQERPECLAGATNLLRRLAIERLQSRERMELPGYTKTVTTRPPLPLVSEVVQWSAQPVSTTGWNPLAGKLAPVARLALDTGSQVDLHVEVGARAPALPIPAPGVGQILFHVPLPDPGQLREIDDANRHIDGGGRFLWAYQPDAHALVVAAQGRVDERAVKVQRERAFLMGQVRGIPHQPEEQRRPAAPPAPSDNTPWDAWRKPRSSFIFYGLKDGVGWLLVRRSDERAVLVPWPRIKAWDEYLPARFGTPDHELGGVLLDQEVNAMLWLSPRSSITRTPSSFAELLALEWPKAK